MKRLLTVLCAVALVIGLLCASAGAEGAEPHGDGNGILSRALLASMYNWLRETDSDFWSRLSFDDISNAVGKWGRVNEKSGEDTHSAVWTDGDSSVTVTFKNKDGFWGVTSITTSLPREEYENADHSFLPWIGNREAGSSPTEETTLTLKTKDSSEEVSVTALVPTEYWYPSVSFGEARFNIAVDASRVSGNSSGLRLSLWSSREAIEAEQAKAENVQEVESLYLLGQEMPGCRYTRSGMDLTDYIARLDEELWLRVSAYQTQILFGSEAEALLKSLTVRKGDFTFHWEPLDLGIDDDDDHTDWLGGDFSLAVIENSDAVSQGLLELTKLESDNLAVYNNWSVGDLSFSHEGESDHYYSYADFDILIIDPDSETPLPILRLWITLHTQERPLNITSLTVTAGGRNYTFTDLSDEEDIEEKEKGGYCQTMLIRFDRNSLSMLTDLALERLLGAESFPVVFHGDQEITVNLGEHFWDVFMTYWELYVNSDAESNLSDYEGNPMTSVLAP